MEKRTLPSGGTRWQSSKKNRSAFIVQKQGRQYTVSDAKGNAIKMDEEQLYRLTEFLDDVCDDIEDSK